MPLKNCHLGSNVLIRYHELVNIYGCQIGDDSSIGPFVEIQSNAVIGNKCKISSHSFICEGVRIGDEVFIGHGVMFINDRLPEATNTEGALKSASDWVLENTVVEDKVSIGSNATILCGVKLGRGSLIGAGSVVTKDVPPHSIVAGNPAKFLKLK
jgi:UDP-2-acetamido-3-amino-2,3-dideoxy-glucuronate N-acetyltransferase